MMTQKDFEMLARVLADARYAHRGYPVRQAVVQGLAESLADELAEINPRFKRDLFLRASMGG